MIVFFWFVDFVGCVEFFQLIEFAGFIVSWVRSLGAVIYLSLSPYKLAFSLFSTPSITNLPETKIKNTNRSNKPNESEKLYQADELY